MRTLSSFRNRHSGQDIYVLGSGKTLDYVDPSFFHGKVVIATNRAAERLGLYDRMQTWQLYAHTHYHDQDAVPLAQAHPHWVFTPLGDQGFAGYPRPENQLRNIVFYPHQPTVFDFDVDRAWHDEGILVGSTSLHGSMHLAAHMGARTVILAGADCGLLDGEPNQSGYVSGNLAHGDQLEWLSRWEMHLRAVKAKLVERYGVAVYSLNPFLNPNLEGHTWQGVR